MINLHELRKMERFNNKGSCRVVCALDELPEGLGFVLE